MTMKLIPPDSGRPESLWDDRHGIIHRVVRAEHTGRPDQTWWVFCTNSVPTLLHVGGRKAPRVTCMWCLANAYGPAKIEELL